MTLEDNLLILVWEINIITNLHHQLMYLQGVQEVVQQLTIEEGPAVEEDHTMVDKDLVDIHKVLPNRDTTINVEDTTTTGIHRRCKGHLPIATMDLILNTCEDSINTLRSTTHNLTMGINLILEMVQTTDIPIIRKDQDSIHQIVVLTNTIPEITMGILLLTLILDQTTALHSTERYLRHLIEV